MKKTLIVVLLLNAFLISNAATMHKTGDTKTRKNDGKITSIKYTLIKMEKKGSCEITMNASLKVSGVGVEVTCKVTADNCEAASIEASNCVKAAVKRVKAALA